MFGVSVMPEPSIPAVRKCLRCGRKFKSDGAGNRICSYCKRIEGMARKTQFYEKPMIKFIDAPSRYVE